MLPICERSLRPMLEGLEADVHKLYHWLLDLVQDIGKPSNSGLRPVGQASIALATYTYVV